MSRAQTAEERAAAWIVAQEDGPWDEADQAAFEAWLGEADGHRTAYLRLRHSWGEADRIGALGGPEPREAGDPARRRLWLPTALAAALVAAVGGAYLSRPGEPPQPVAIERHVFETRVGGHKLVSLPDGSRIQLNTASVMRTTLGGRRREVWLDRGEAFFEVAHIEGRPFVVHAGDRRITVLGTKFGVRRDGGKVIVTVVEGRVQVENADGEAPPALLGRGDIALAQGDATLVTSRSEEKVEDVLAWRTGMLSFQQARLGDVAAEFNRYNSLQIAVPDQKTADIRIGGVFPATQPDAFVRLLAEAYGLTVEKKFNLVTIST